MAILGEEHPGFELWTSAHGFHHLKLTQSSGWKAFWTIVLLICSIALIACVIYYFYYVFALGIYSRFLIVTPQSMPWPTTIICDRQMFSFAKVSQVQLLSSSHAALLSWSVSPTLARPDVMNNTRVAQLTADINTVLSRSDYNKLSYGPGGAIPGGPMEQLLRAIAPNCTQLILQCIVGSQVMTGWECCAKIFDPTPYFTVAGTCFSTRGAPMRNQVTVAGDASALTITTMHDIGNTFDPLFVAPQLYGVSGLSFAVVDDHVTPQAAMASRAMSVSTGQMVSVGLSRMVVDNADLGWSAIAQTRCYIPGDRTPAWVDADLNYGVSYNYGYSVDSCTMISKQEMLARELLFCTFSPLVGDNMGRCTANQSVAYYWSFLGANQTITPDLPVFYIDNKAGLRRRYEKPCPADCIQDRYTLNPTFTPYTTTQQQTIQTLVTGSGQNIQGANPNTIVTKLFMRSLEYQRIYNFPQNGVQFIAELGGLMCFFLGISIISVIECLCYCCCCGCKDGDDEEEK